MKNTALDGLTRDLTGEFAFAGIAVSRAGERSFHLSAPGHAATERTLFRVASISKIVTGWTARMALVRGRDGINPRYRDITVEEVLGFPFRHPLSPDTPLTVGQIAGHCAGLTDAAGYVVPPGVALEDWLAQQGPGIWSAHAPGTYFEYSNLGYLILAAVAEVAAGERFDTLARRLVLDRLNIEGGFNWSGVLTERRSDRLATYRRGAEGFAPQIDAEVGPGGIIGPDGAQALTEDYRIGRDMARLSPQGGLRLSLTGMLQLAEALPKGPLARLWSPDRGGGDYVGGVFDSYGWGMQFLDAPPFYPRPLIGHFANAYGFMGGVWQDAQTGVAFAYALNGLPEGDDSDELSPAEARIFAALANLA